MSEGIEIEIDFDDDTITIAKSSGTYTYQLDEIPNDVVDRLLVGNASYTVYSQKERITKEEFEEQYGNMGELLYSRQQEEI